MHKINIVLKYFKFCQTGQHCKVHIKLILVKYRKAQEFTKTGACPLGKRLNLTNILLNTSEQ